MRQSVTLAVIAWLLAGHTFAADTPAAGSGDLRVRYVTYDKDQVTRVQVRVGTVSRVVLGDDERIVVSASGMSADCQNPDSLWCIRADVDTHEIWVKPKPGARRNNLELRTDRRNYSIEFVAGEAKTAGKASAPMFRVIYRYPAPVPQMSALMAQAATVSRLNEGAVLDDRLGRPPVPQNWKYTQKARRGSDDIKPSLVFDDGRFTYFRFAGNQEVPTIFYIDPSGAEARINYHMEGDLSVVERIGRRFVLRLGTSVVGIWNDAYSAASDGSHAGNPSGTTVAGVERKVIP